MRKLGSLATLVAFAAMMGSAWGAALCEAGSAAGAGLVEASRSATFIAAVSKAKSAADVRALILGAKVRALCEGRDEITRDDIRSIAVPALSHRMLFNFEGQADRVDPDGLIREILDVVK